MGMKMLLEEAVELSDGVWSAKVSPHEVPIFGQPKATIGGRSVLLTENATFIAATRCLQVDGGSVSVLNQGTTPETLVVEAKASDGTLLVTTEKGQIARFDRFGPGDREFLGMVGRELQGHPREAAERILQEVRARYPGDLQRGQRSNFKNTPDNFWYVIVQPRAQSLSITVRGARDRFKPSKLELKDDRPGYTRFSLKHPSEVANAVQIIERSKRRKANPYTLEYF